MASSRKKIGVDLKIIGFAIIVRCIKFVDAARSDSSAGYC